MRSAASDRRAEGYSASDVGRGREGLSHEASGDLGKVEKESLVRPQVAPDALLEDDLPASVEDELHLVAIRCTRDVGKNLFLPLLN